MSSVSKLLKYTPFIKVINRHVSLAKSDRQTHSSKSTPILHSFKYVSRLCFDFGKDLSTPHRVVFGGRTTIAKGFIGDNFSHHKYLPSLVKPLTLLATTTTARHHTTGMTTMMKGRFSLSLSFVSFQRYSACWTEPSTYLPNSIWDTRAMVRFSFVPIVVVVLVLVSSNEDDNVRFHIITCFV